MAGGKHTAKTQRAALAVACQTPNAPTPAFPLEMNSVATGTLVKTVAMEKEILSCNDVNGPLTRDIETFIVPPLLGIFASGLPRLLGLAAWIAMALSYIPTLRFYRLSPLWGFAMPAIGMVYAAFTVQSAIQHWRGKGGMWKGRAQALVGR